MRSGASIRNQFSRLARGLGVLALGLLFACQKGSDTDGHTALVFAAASLSDALNEIGEAFREETGMHVRFNFAGSQALAQQIAASGRGDVFISADERWMDFVAAKDGLEAGTRVGLLSNRLALVCASGAGFRIGSAEDLCELDFRFLCIGDPDAVPAGRYARAWLEQESCVNGESLWDRIRGRVSPAPDVRAALEQVLGRTDSIGVVYRTDYLQAGDRARLLLESPLAGIRYPLALLKDRADEPAGAAFYRFVQSDRAMAIFEQHGFGRAEQ